MIEVSYKQLNTFMDMTQSIRKYALTHYDEHKSKAAVHTLYGPHSCFAGAVTPTHLVPGRERRLVHRTRREKYNVYEFDQSFSPIRVTKVFGGQASCVYHIFNWEGMVCCCPFQPNSQHFGDYRTILYQFSNQKPVFYVRAFEKSIFCEIYEYPASGKRLCTGYMFSRNQDLKICGIRPNWEAPLGAPDSPVVKHSYEYVPPEMDFSKWFR